MKLSPRLRRSDVFLLFSFILSAFLSSGRPPGRLGPGPSSDGGAGGRAGLAGAHPGLGLSLDFEAEAGFARTSFSGRGGEIGAWLFARRQAHAAVRHWFEFLPL